MSWCIKWDLVYIGEVLIGPGCLFKPSKAFRTQVIWSSMVMFTRILYVLNLFTIVQGY